MKACIIGWLILALVLTALGQFMAPFLGRCSDEDSAFAHEYAGEMLAKLEQMSAESAAPADCCQAGEADFHSRKQAAVHFKGELAADFVYAFSCAEAWCHYAAAGQSAADRTGAALARAKAEFRAIAAKDYKTAGR